MISEPSWPREASLADDEMEYPGLGPGEAMRKRGGDPARLEYVTEDSLTSFGCSTGPLVLINCEMREFCQSLNFHKQNAGDTLQGSQK